MESYGNNMFLSQEGYASIDFTLLDRPSTSVASAPESTAALLPDSSFPSFDFLDNSGVDSFGGVLHTAGEAHFDGQRRSEMGKDIDWRKEKTLHGSSNNMYIQGGGNQEPVLSSPQFHIPVSQVDFFTAKQSCSDNVQAQLSTSGNRVGDGVHDFFEQEHLSQQQSQLERREKWSLLNNNAWSVDNRNEESHYINHSTHNTESSNMQKSISGSANNPSDNAAFDHSRSNNMVSTAMLSFMPTESQADDGRHVSRMALGSRSPQGPNNNIMKTQPRNQPLNFDSLLTASSASNIRENQVTSAGDGGTPERSQSNLSNLDGTDTKQGHQALNLGRNNSDGGESLEAQVNYDFLGNQIHLKGQPQAGLQYHGASLQPGLDEMQVWKQQYSYQHMQELHRQQQAQKLERQVQEQQAQKLENQIRQQLQLEQQARQRQAQQFEQQMKQQVQQLMPHARQQQSQQLMPHTRQQQSQQLILQARQQQAQQLEQQARQQAQQLEQARQQAQQLEQARQQQAQQLEQQARQQQAQQLEQQARQQQALQLEQQARQQRVLQLEQQARQQRAQLFEQQARLHQAQQIEQHTRQQQAQQLEQHTRQQQAQQLDQRTRQQQVQQLEQHTRHQQAQQSEQNTRQQQAQQLDQHARQQQAQQLEQQHQKQLQHHLAGDNQNLVNHFSPSLYGSSLHDGSNFMRSASLMSQMGIENPTPTPLPGNQQHFNVGSMNRMPNGLSSLPFPPEILLSQDPNLALQALAMMGAPLDASVYGLVANTRDAAGQSLSSYPSSQGAVQQLAEAPHKLASATSHQVGKPVAHTIGFGASVLGDNRTISCDPTSAKYDGKQGALNKSLLAQSFPPNQGMNNLQQETTISRTPQLQDFPVKQQHRSWNEDLGKKDNFQGGSSQVLGNADGPSESGFYNLQPGGWHSLPPTQVVAGSDARNRTTSTGQYAPQGAYHTANTDFLGSLTVNPQGSWSALMQSAVAESPSGDGDHDDWNGLNLQKTETNSGDSLQFHPNVKEQSIWSEQNDQVNNSINGRSFHLFNDDSVQSVQTLPHRSSEGRGHFGSQLERIQHGNQNKLQSGPSSKFLQEATGQPSRWQDQSLYQHIDETSNPHSYSSFQNRHGNSWINQNIDRVPSEDRLPSHNLNLDGGQQNNSLQNQGSFKTESHRMFSLTSKDQSDWNKRKAQETEQNNSREYQENENENIMHLESGPVSSHVEKVEDPIYQARYEGNKDTSASFRCQDPKMNVYQNGQPLQQEDFSADIFSRNINEDNMENSAERRRQTPESKYQLDSANNAIGNASIYCQASSSQAWNLFPNSFSSPQRETSDKKAQYSQNDSKTAAQIAGKADPDQQIAKSGSDYTRNSPQGEDDLQSLSNTNHRGYSRLSKMNIGMVENSGNNILRMTPGHMSQQTVGNANYQPTECGIQDLSLRGALHLDSLGQKSPEQRDFGQPNVARTVLLNSTMHTGEDVLSTSLQNHSREKAGGEYFKDISLGHTSTNSPAFDRPTNIGSSIKPASLPSQNMLDLLTMPDHLKESDASKDNVFGEQNTSVEPCQSSSDVSLVPFGRNQSTGPSQGFGLRLATTPQLLQMLHGRSLQSSTPSQTTKVLNDRQIHPSKEDNIQRSVASATHQGSSSKVASIADGQSLHLTASAKPVHVPFELSTAAPKENTIDLMEKPSCISTSDIHPSKMQYMQHTNVMGKLASSPQSMVLHAVPERQSNVQGSTKCTNQLQGSQDVAIEGQSTLACNAVTQSMVSSVDAVIDKKSEMQGSFPPSTRSFGQSSYPSELLAQDGQNHKMMSLPSSMSGLRNSDRGLHESLLNSASHLPGTSGSSHSAAFLKLLNAYKADCANQERMPMGAEKVFPSVFESFRPPVGGSGQSFMPRLDSQLKYGMGGKPEALMRNQLYRPHIINSQQPTSAEELSKQDNLFQQMVSDRGESSGSPAPQNSLMGLPVAVSTLPRQTSVLNSQLSMLHSQGQDQRNFLMSKIHVNPSSIVSPLQNQINSSVGQDSQEVLRSTCPPTQQKSDSCSDGPVDSQASELSDAHRHQYVSSNQFVSMTGMQNDFDKKAVKRMKITDAGIGSSVSAKSSEQLTDPHTPVGQFKVTSTARTAHELGALSVDGRTHPSQGIRDRSEAASIQGMAAMIQRRLQNQGYNDMIYQSSQTSLGAGDRSHVNPQYANSRSMQFGTHTNQKLYNLQMAEMYKRIGGSGRSATLTSKQITPGRNVELLFPAAGSKTPITSYPSESALKEVESTAPVQNPVALSLPPSKGNDMHQYQYYLSKSNIGPPVTVLSKKRKKVASPLIPWHIEIAQGGGELPSTRDAEVAWATATNRLAEKEEDEIGNHEEGTKSVARVKRRLKLTTQLMQQIIPPLPNAVVSGKASVEHENATYTLAKTALGDACKLVTTWSTDLEKDVEDEELALGQPQKYKKLKGKSTLQTAEGFMDMAKKLDDEFLRMDASLSITELRSETQDLDKLAITNRLFKHHGKSLPVDTTKIITEERDSSSDSSFCNRKQCPQRYVTAVPMPRNLPEGVLCFSL